MRCAITLTIGYSQVKVADSVEELNQNGYVISTELLIKRYSISTLYLHSLRKLRQGPHQTNRQPNFFEDNLTDRFAELHFKNVSNVIFSFSFPFSFSKFQAANMHAKSTKTNTNKHSVILLALLYGVTFQ